MNNQLALILDYGIVFFPPSWSRSKIIWWCVARKLGLQKQ